MESCPINHIYQFALKILQLQYKIVVIRSISVNTVLNISTSIGITLVFFFKTEQSQQNRPPSAAEEGHCCLTLIAQ